MQRLWEVRDLPKPFTLCGRHTIISEEMLNCYTIGKVTYPLGGLMPAGDPVLGGLKENEV
jgi:hypothetical protein